MFYQPNNPENCHHHPILNNNCHLILCPLWLTVYHFHSEKYQYTFQKLKCLHRYRLVGALTHEITFKGKGHNFVSPLTCILRKLSHIICLCNVGWQDICWINYYLKLSWSTTNSTGEEQNEKTKGQPGRHLINQSVK